MATTEFDPNEVVDRTMFFYRGDLGRISEYAQTVREFPQNHIRKGEKRTLGDSATAIRAILDERDRFQSALEQIASGTGRANRIPDAEAAQAALDSWAFQVKSRA